MLKVTGEQLNKEIKAKIPHRIIGGISSYGKIYNVKMSVIEKLGKSDVSAIEMIYHGFRTRTTRSKQYFTELNKVLNVNDYFVNYGKLDINGEGIKNVNILSQVTAIYNDTDDRFLMNFHKEGWSEGDKKNLNSMTKGAGCIEFKAIGLL